VGSEHDDEPRQPFTGTVRRSHPMEPGSMVLVLERYAGDVDVGDEVVVVRGGTETRVKVAQMAWGSSFGLEAPPLTLVVTGLDDTLGYAGVTLKSPS
jgi:hypothetical protein